MLVPLNPETLEEDDDVVAVELFEELASPVVEDDEADPAFESSVLLSFEDVVEESEPDEEAPLADAADGCFVECDGDAATAATTLGVLSAATSESSEVASQDEVCRLFRRCLLMSLL